MKKHLLLLIVLCLSFAMQAKNTLVSTKTAFTTAWGIAADGDTITVAYNGGVILNTGAVNLPAAGGVITVRGQYPDSLPIIQTEFDGVTLADGVTTGLIFENLHMQYRTPDNTSGQVIYFSKKYANISKLIFRGCEISRTVRSLFRSVKPDSISPTERWASCGDVEYFEMSNCKVHNTTLTIGNNFPLIYFGHLPIEVNFKNNSFYDLPYLKSIFTMNYADANQGRNAIINFENNTVSFTPTQGALIATGSYLGPEAQFNFKNNVFMVPNWVNATNIDAATFAKPKILTSRYGLVTASNNLIQGYNSWSSGQSIDADGQGAFVGLDTIPQNTMESLGVKWEDFANPQAGNYSYLFTNPMATAGSTGGPIGDPRWVLRYNNPRALNVSADNASAVVTPIKDVYEDGTSVKVTASPVVGFNFVNWRDTLGNVVSTANPYTFNITANTNLVAHYEALLTKAVSITLKGTNTATFTITPTRTTYYAGDIITTTLNTHAINNFLGWSDGKITLVRVDTLLADLILTAKFSQLPYLMAWDFSHLTANNATYSSLAANVALNPANKGVMNMILGKDTLAANFGTRNNKFIPGELNYCAIRKSFNAKTDPDYLYIKFSTKGKTGLKVAMSMATDNCIYKIQKMEYSLDSITYTTFATDSMPTDSASLWSKWKTMQGSLPMEAQDKETVFVRFISDPTSTKMATASSDKKWEYAYISKVVVLADLDMGGASWRVNPLESYVGGQQITSVPGIKLTLGGPTNVWSNTDTTFTFGNATYISTINGTVNPVDGAGKKFSASGGTPPTVGAFYKFDVQTVPENDTLDVAIIINAAKPSYIVENTTAMAGYSNFQVTVKTYASYSIPVKSNTSYYFFSEGSKMGMLGFVLRKLGLPTATKNVLKSNNAVYSSGNSLYVKVSTTSKISVYDMMGKVVRSVNAVEGVNEISGLNKGIYIVRIGAENIKVLL